MKTEGCISIYDIMDLYDVKIMKIFIESKYVCGGFKTHEDAVAYDTAVRNVAEIMGFKVKRIGSPCAALTIKCGDTSLYTFPWEWSGPIDLRKGRSYVVKLIDAINAQTGVLKVRGIYAKIGSRMGSSVEITRVLLDEEEDRE